MKDGEKSREGPIPARAGESVACIDCVRLRWAYPRSRGGICR